uniref:Chitinase 9 n=1 Tax=Tetranychus cinnabarinus TaxID=93129 RepID=A0A2H4QGR6_TETCI|nr:chitinase 9 [Tetranychus cinnabarinus]
MNRNSPICFYSFRAHELRKVFKVLDSKNEWMQYSGDQKGCIHQDMYSLGSSLQFRAQRTGYRFKKSNRSDKPTYLDLNHIFKVLINVCQKSSNGGGSMVQDAAEVSNKIVCYLFTWAIYRTNPMNYGIDDVPGDLCTHLVYAYLGLDEKTNEIKFPDKYFDYNECASDDMTCQNKSSSESHSLNRRFEKFADLRAKWPNLKIMVSVGGWLENGAKYSLMISEKGSRQKFISSVMSFLSQYKLDGLDLDWKYPGVPWRGGELSDVTNFSHLLKWNPRS